MFLEKKGSVNLVLSLIIVVIVFVILIVFASNSTSIFTSLADDELCSITKDLGDSDAIDFNLFSKCPTTFVNINDTGIFLNNDKIKEYTKEDSIKTVADEVVKCWNKMGGGKLENSPRSKSRCTICSDITISTDKFSSIEFSNFLRTTILNTKTKETYEEKLTKHLTEDSKYFYNLGYFLVFSTPCNELGSQLREGCIKAQDEKIHNYLIINNLKVNLGGETDKYTSKIILSEGLERNCPFGVQ